MQGRLRSGGTRHRAALSSNADYSQAAEPPLRLAVDHVGEYLDLPRDGSDDGALDRERAVRAACNTHRLDALAVEAERGRLNLLSGTNDGSTCARWS